MVCDSGLPVPETWRVVGLLVDAPYELWIESQALHVGRLAAQTAGAYAGGASIQLRPVLVGRVRFGGRK